MEIDLEAFAQRTLSQIPLLGHMQLRFSAFDSTSLTLDAPLAPNINDKQTAFGGSIVALATLCGWALTSLIGREAGFECDVMVASSEMSYKAPVDGDFSAEVHITEARRKALLASLRGRAKAKVTLAVAVMQGGAVKAEFTGDYVVKIKVVKIKVARSRPHVPCGLD